MTEQYRTHADKVVDSLAANPSDDVIADESRTLVGSELLDLITRLSHALAAQGVSRGNTVAILAPIAIEAIAIRYAATRLGCVTVLAIGPIPGVPTDLLALARDASTASLRIDVDESDPCVLVATGGTTGVSKASVRSAGACDRLVDLGPTPGRRQLICTPLPYIAQTLVDTVLIGGGQLVLRRTFEPEMIANTIAEKRVTHLALVEPLLVELLDGIDIASHDLSSLIAISHIGAGASPALRRRLLGRAGRNFLVHPYGASEFGVISALAGPEYSLDRPELLSSAGKPIGVGRDPDHRRRRQHPARRRHRAHHRAHHGDGSGIFGRTAVVGIPRGPLVRLRRRGVPRRRRLPTHSRAGVR